MKDVLILKPNPEQDFNSFGSNLETLDTITGKSVPVEFQPINETTANIVVDGEARMLREDIYNEALESGKFIKIDLNKSRLRKIDPNKIKSLRPTIGSTPPPVEVKDIEVETTKLRDVQFDQRLFVPLKTNSYFDTFASRKGGVMPGSVTMITGDAGVGKSSILMDILVNMRETNSETRALYVSAEMERIDVHEFVEFYPQVVDIDFLYLSDYIVNPDAGATATQALVATLAKGWDIIVFDSYVEIQSIVQEEFSISSKKAENWLLTLMGKHNAGHNKMNIFTAFLAIQQQNKGGEFVGSNRLKHMTTAFLKLCWDKKQKGKRFMIYNKNRKGKEKVKLFYNLDPDKGVVYDGARHTKELEILERMAAPDEFDIEEYTFDQFNKLLATPPEEQPQN